MTRPRRTTLLGSPLPVVAAPMAGGPTTLELASAVTEAGGFAILPGGYRTPDALAQQVDAARAWGRPFGVNLFVPDAAGHADPAVLAAYAQRIAPDAAEHGLTYADLRAAVPSRDDDRWAEKVALLVERPVPVVSFTFGLPSPRDIRTLRAAGTVVLVTVTTPDEAGAAEEAGVDGLVVQGPHAGGHSGTWDPSRTVTDTDTADVVASVAARTRLPIVGAGGVDGPDAAAHLRAAGAEAVAVGTLLLRTHESGTTVTHRDALVSPRCTGTIVTRAFTGRPARALRNSFAERHDAAAPVGYPQVHHLTRELRRRAAAAGDADRLHLWAGTGFRAARAVPAADVVRDLAARW
ncbi:nitronate monooxygenase [Isoptericola hypogeus]|uniref:Propionate 3-nitronate monooxygenase n=1 Tax=Isoptericola hypogeus TaxID=300179 RepID=A0ABP4VUK9_9MICO